MKYCNRPFSSIVEHDQKLIEYWNKCVSKKDEVYHLGDFGFGSPSFLLEKIANNLNGRIHLIKGNHDHKILREPLINRFETIQDVKLIKTQKNGKKVIIFLSHYAHLSWPFSYHKSYHLFGHSHGTLPGVSRSLDVGVDCRNFMPISINSVIDLIDSLEITEKENH